ncbi:lipocalin [Amia ocellicauda]|uniref:lipocalin n=1 Tax=Amia ocellicauda TaxID=2972642 RepID=UPI003463CEA5|nr:LIPO protein [Amia calva]
MTSMLLTALGVLLCVLATSADVQPQKDFNLQKFSGKWYLIGFATNAPWFVAKKTAMKQGVVVFTPTAGGDLDMSYSSKKADGTCWQATHLATKTETPGRFTFFSQRWGNNNDMRIVESKYEEYTMVYTIKTKGEDTSTLLKIYSRTTELRPELLQKFRQFCIENGIEKDNIAILPVNDECVF